MTVVVLGKHDPERPEDPREPVWSAPPEVGRMPPPDVKLAYREPAERAGQRQTRRQNGHGKVRNRAKESVEQNRRIVRDHGMVEI